MHRFLHENCMEQTEVLGGVNMVILISIISGIAFTYCTSSLIDDFMDKFSRPDITITTYSLIDDFEFMAEKKSAPGDS